MTEPRPEDALGTAEQRRHERKPVPGIVTLCLEGRELPGRVNNLSEGGVMLVSDDSLRVTVEVEQDGRSIRRTGRLIRVQRLNAVETVYAVEFDEA